METIIKNDVKEIDWPETTFLTIRATLPFDKLTTFFSEKYTSLYNFIGKAGLTAKEPPCAIYYSVDEKNMKTDLAAAIPVTGTVQESGEIVKVVVPASKALAITHYGSYDSMGETYAVLQKHVKDHDLKTKWMIEQYLSDPEIEKDPKTWKTNIYFVLDK